MFHFLGMMVIIRVLISFTLALRGLYADNLHGVLTSEQFGLYSEVPSLCYIISVFLNLGNGFFD